MTDTRTDWPGSVQCCGGHTERGSWPSSSALVWAASGRVASIWVSQARPTTHRTDPQHDTTHWWQQSQLPPHRQSHECFTGSVCHQQRFNIHVSNDTAALDTGQQLVNKQLTSPTSQQWFNLPRTMRWTLITTVYRRQSINVLNWWPSWQLNVFGDIITNAESSDAQSDRSPPQVTIWDRRCRFCLQASWSETDCAVGWTATGSHPPQPVWQLYPSKANSCCTLASNTHAQGKRPAESRAQHCRHWSAADDRHKQTRSLGDADTGSKRCQRTRPDDWTPTRHNIMKSENKMPPLLLPAWPWLLLHGGQYANVTIQPRTARPRHMHRWTACADALAGAQAQEHLNNSLTSKQ